MAFSSLRRIQGSGKRLSPRRSNGGCLPPPPPDFRTAYRRATGWRSASASIGVSATAFRQALPLKYARRLYTGRAARLLCALATLLVLLLPTTAQAQTSTTLVSNFDQTSVDSLLVGESGFDHYSFAQRFTAGDNAELASVQIYLSPVDRQR